MVRIVKFSVDSRETPELLHPSFLENDDWDDDEVNFDFSVSENPQMFNNPDDSRSDIPSHKPNDSGYKKNNPCKPRKKPSHSV